MKKTKELSGFFSEEIAPSSRRMSTFSIEKILISYARDIAAHFGVSFENIIKTLQERNIIKKGLNTGRLTQKINSED